MQQREEYCALLGVKMRTLKEDLEDFSSYRERSYSLGGHTAGLPNIVLPDFHSGSLREVRLFLRVVTSV